MAPSWLDELERSLEQRLDAFLRANPHQNVLLQQQHLQDRQRGLQTRLTQLQDQAKDLRHQLLALASDVRDWNARSQRARDAGAQPLAERADQHIQTLMAQGRELWGELDTLGTNFRTVEHQLSQLMADDQKASPDRSLNEDWALFEAEQELEQLRRKNGLI